MNASKHEIRRGVYYDSVVLMQLQLALTGLPGVLDAAVVMATPANRAVLASTGFSVSNIEAKPEDLLIVVKASAIIFRSTGEAVSHAAHRWAWTSVKSSSWASGPGSTPASPTGKPALVRSAPVWPCPHGGVRKGPDGLRRDLPGVMRKT